LVEPSQAEGTLIVSSAFCVKSSLRLP